LLLEDFRKNSYREISDSLMKTYFIIILFLMRLFEKHNKHSTSHAGVIPPDETEINLGFF